MLIESFHSGQRGQRLYCSLHRPMTRLVRSTGVVLCYPTGHEYFRIHRSYVKLADQLARLGFPVLRFDWMGSGDSEGDAGRTLDDWLEQIQVAAHELQRSEPISHIALGGARLGATLAMLGARRIDSVRALLLWEPVLDGARHVEDLQRLHARMLGDLERFPRVRRKNECAEGELIGTRYSDAFLRDIAAIRPAALATEGVSDIVLVAVTDPELPEPVSGRARVHAASTARDHGWRDAHRIGETILDLDAVRHLAGTMNAVAA